MGETFPAAMCCCDVSPVMVMVFSVIMLVQAVFCVVGIYVGDVYIGVYPLWTGWIIAALSAASGVLGVIAAIVGFNSRGGGGSRTMSIVKTVASAALQVAMCAIYGYSAYYWASFTCEGDCDAYIRIWIGLGVSAIVFDVLSILDLVTAVRWQIKQMRHHSYDTI